MIEVILNIILFMSTPVALFCFLVLAFFIIFLRLYGEDFIPTVFHKRNKFWSLVWIGIFLLCTGVIIIPRMMKKIPDCFNVEVKILGVTCTRYVLVQIIILFFLAIYSFDYIYHCIGCSFRAGRYLRDCEKQISDGALIEIKEKILVMPWYFLRKSDQNAYYLLLCRFYARTNSSLDVVKTANKIDTDRLYSDDFEKYCFILSTAYVGLGAFVKGENTIKQLEDRKDCNHIAEYWNIKCYIEDSKGNLQIALNCAKKGLDVAREEEFIIRCRLNNNLSRLLALCGDEQNALIHMRWAKKQISQMKKPDMYLVHIIYSNLILMLVRENHENPEIEALREAYYKIIEKNETLENDIQYRNTVIEMFRQSGINTYYYVIIQGYKDTIKKLKEQYGEKITQERIANEVSTLKMLVNGNFSLKEIVKDINQHFKYYKNVSKKEMLFAYHELFTSISQMPDLWKKHFEMVSTNIIKYYERDGLTDVDKIIESLDEYDVYGYVEWLRYKMYILKVVRGTEYYTHAVPLREALIEKCHREGFYKGELREKMLWLNDMVSPEVWDEKEEKPPLIMKNKGLIEDAAAQYEQYKEYPEVFEHSIMLSYLYLIFEEREKSRQYLLDFLDRHVDIHSYAGWLRFQFYHLLCVHDMKDRVDSEDYARISIAGGSNLYMRDMGILF